MSLYYNTVLQSMGKTWMLFPILILAFVISPFGNSLHATHIIGGDITYKCLGDGDYEVTLTVRRDCGYGEEPFDQIAHIGIYDGYGNLLPWFGVGGMIQIEKPSQIDTIDSSLDTGCGFLGTPVCVEEAVYIGKVNLPYRNTGYYFGYQRCCRNSTLDNILDPLLSGSTYYTRLTEKALTECNNSPTFNDWPTLYICANETLSFDHSATDIDGDSLVYKLCSPSLGGTFDDPQPVPPAGPPYADVIFTPPFSVNDPMGGVPLTINSSTGAITAVPNAIGQFLIGICVEEYRDGEVISYTRRDFEYNVRVCTEGPMAAFDAPDLTCDGLTVQFDNESSGADSYNWNFNFPSTDPAFMSTLESPEFTYTEGGSYVVSLEAVRDIDGCSKTIMDTIQVYISEAVADFTAEISSCNSDSTNIQLTDLSSDPDFPITAWNWTASTNSGFQGSANTQNPIIKVPKDDNVSITLIATAENGCTATKTIEIDADPLDLEVIADPMMICQGDTVQILLNANCSGDVIYSIIPLTNVSFDPGDDSHCNIYIAPEADITYTIFASNGICFDSTSITATITEKSDLSISGDSISCDGNFNLQVDGGINMNQFEWSFNEDFDPIVGDMTENFTEPFPAGDTTATVYVRVKDGTGCSNIASYDVILEAIDITTISEITLCEGVDTEIIIQNNSEDQTITVVWEDNPLIITNNGTSIIINSSDVDLMESLNYTVSNNFGCSLTGSIDVDVLEAPELSFDWEVNCLGPNFCFNNTTQGNYDYFWDFGDTTTEGDTSHLESPCYEFPGPGTYTVSLFVDGGPCGGEVITHDVVVPVVLEMTIEPNVIDACIDEDFDLTANVNVDGVIIQWFDNGMVIGEGEMITYSTDESTTIVVTATDSLGCEVTEEVPVDIYMFDIEVNVPDINCVGEEVPVSITNNSEGDDFTYTWTPADLIISGQGTNEVVISATETTTINVVVTNNTNGCVEEVNFDFNVSIIDAELYADPEEPYQCTEGEIGVVSPDGDWTFEWDHEGETGSSFLDTLLETKTYTVTITDEFGCTAVESITVNVLLPNCDESDVFLPTAFSPNGDNVNDVLFVRSNFIKEMNFIIYNRWGEKIFTSTDKDLGWDGVYGGEQLAPDVYAYSLAVTCSNGAEYVKIGNVTLVR